VFHDMLLMTLLVLLLSVYGVSCMPRIWNRAMACMLSVQFCFRESAVW
jgi:hypothetical protein